MATANDYINTMYSNKRKSDLAGLESQYKQNVNKLDTQEAEMPQKFYDAKRDATAAEGKSKLTMNEITAANGLNTGAVGQMNLARANVASRNMADIMQSEADAYSDIARQRADLAAAYKTNVQAAIANSDFDKANALFTEYKDDRDLARAQADKLLTAGLKPSSSLVTKSGYSTDYVNKLYKAMQK